MLGNGVLLAVYGWENLAREAKRRLRLSLSSAATFVLLLPAASIIAHKFYAPAARIDRWIAASTSEIAIIDNQGAPFADDLVLNRPDLSNRPIRLAGQRLQLTDATALCASSPRVLFVGAPQLQPLRAVFGLAPATASPHDIALRRTVRDAGCIVVDLAGPP